MADRRSAVRGLLRISNEEILRIELKTIMHNLRNRKRRTRYVGAKISVGDERITMQALF